MFLGHRWMESGEASVEIPLRNMATATRSGAHEDDIQLSVGDNRLRRSVGFFTLGLLNNLPYVVILTAALELLPSDVPTGVLAFVNIAPALIAKAVFPYVLKGEIHYAQRVVACVAGAFGGMLVTALFESLMVRLSGVATASFMSGLGEITYLQFTTRYPSKITEHCVGWFASGTGAAGLAGALAWWIVRPWGVRTGLGLLCLLPFGMALAFFSLPASPTTEASPSSRDEATHSLMNEGNAAESDEQDEISRSYSARGLSFGHKMRLLRPMLYPYILPLVSVYFAEYTINQGIVCTRADTRHLLYFTLYQIQENMLSWQR